MSISLQLYLLFAKISLFTFGGGYAMIPLFQNELVTVNGFLTDAEFANMVALAQMTPGPVGLNAATYVGFNQAGIIGAAAGTLGLMTPSFILAVLAAIFVKVFKDNPTMQAVLSGVRPAVLGLIAAAVIFFADTSVFSAPLRNMWTAGASFGLCWPGLLIFAITIAMELSGKIHMLWTLLVAGALGALLLT
ncbi:MAG TPA: chromate transporter [Lentisphaeria bacterium]|nr:chromate transporter [Lentisphaeria bacterium]